MRTTTDNKAPSLGCCRRDRPFSTNSDDADPDHNKNPITDVMNSDGFDGAIHRGRQFTNGRGAAAVKEHTRCRRHRGVNRRNDPHRYPTAAHKKKYPTRHERTIPGIRCPTIPGNYHGGRVDPKPPLSSKYHGKIWIRPLAAKDPKFAPATARAAPSHASKCHRVEDGGLENSYASVSPHRAVQSFTLPEVEVALSYTSPGSFGSSSSFDSYERQHGCDGPKKTRIIFGQSGKPIKTYSMSSIRGANCVVADAR